MRRRVFIAILGSAAVTWPRAARAQQPSAAPRIGFLGPAEPPPALLAAFQRGLREAGFVDGTSIIIDYQFAQGSLERLPALARTLVDQQVDVIVTRSTPAALAAKRATSTIPVVFVEVGDPIKAGLIKSLARPEANITGVSSLAPDLSGKRLELLREINPHAAHIAVLWNPDNPTTGPKLQMTELAAQTLGLHLSKHPVSKAVELNDAFVTMRSGGAEAVVALLDTIVLDNRDEVVALAAKFSLPAIYEVKEMVEVGGLLSYGTSFSERFSRAATYVGKLLNGAKPGDLPVEQPTKFELVINLNTAKALGLTVPPALLGRADEVIE